MPVHKIKSLLTQLQKELNNTTSPVDDDTKAQLAKLDASIHQVLNPENKLAQTQDIYEGIQAMEYEFLTKHPVTSGIMREMVEILSKAGI